MGISIKKIKYWWKMITGKSIFHVKQDKGKYYRFDRISGYYNDLTRKVLADKEHLSTIEPFLLPGQNQLFPISVFQYGLGAFDLFIETNEEIMLQKFLSHANWALDNILQNGGWISFPHNKGGHVFSAMAQGEGISILVRAYSLTKEKIYLDTAQRAFDFMIKEIENGGTCHEDENDLVFFEFTNKPVVFNGWMFAIFGVMDLLIVNPTKEIKRVFDKTITSLINLLPKMDNGYWSIYRLNKKIASPFYHNLHIAQLTVLYEYTNRKEFLDIRNKFVKYQNSKKCRMHSFIKKTFQKIFGRD